MAPFPFQKSPRAMLGEPRIRCCIHGCRRTFRRSKVRGTETMCTRHYGCAPDLKAAHQESKKRAKKYTRRLEKARKRWSATSSFIAYLTGQETEAWQFSFAAWVAIKLRAQKLQDDGHFAPKPRGRFNTSHFPTSNDAAKRDQPRIGHSFEAEFRRLKRFMA